jgi:hypothetical protein
MKKIVFLIVIFVLALGAGCKKKEVSLPEPPPPPQPPEVQTVYSFMKDCTLNLSLLEPRKVIEITVGDKRVIDLKGNLYPSTKKFYFSLFPDTLSYPEASFFVAKYLFPSVKLDWGMPIVDLQDYLIVAEEGDLFVFSKKSPDPSKHYDYSPMFLVRTSEEMPLLDVGEEDNEPMLLEKIKYSEVWVLDQNRRDEMPLRANWGK